MLNFNSFSFYPPSGELITVTIVDPVTLRVEHNYEGPTQEFLVEADNGEYDKLFHALLEHLKSQGIEIQQASKDRLDNMLNVLYFTAIAW